MPTRRALLAMPILATPALSQRRPLRIIVPFPAGGAVDGLGRIMAERLGALLEQTVVVENRAGGGGIVGADAVAKGPPDGTMLGIIGAATLLATPLLQAMPFNPATDLRALTQITDSAVLCVANTERARRENWNSLADVIATIRANPGRMRLAGSGVTTVSHFTVTAIGRAAGVETIHVPYRGGAETVAGILAGEVDFACDLPATFLGPVQGGQLRAMTVSAGTRLSLLPDVPGFSETPATRDFDIRTWNMLMVPANTPEAEVQRLFAAIRRMSTEAEFTARLARLAYVPVTQDSPAAAEAFIRAEAPRWRAMVELSGARVGG